MSEVRVMAEGELRFVQASGSGQSWATAAGAASGLFGYVQAFQFTSGQTVTTIRERGTPSHHKVTERAPVQVQMTLLSTGGLPSPASGAGASVPLWHLEFKQRAPERGVGSAFYYQFHGCALTQAEVQEQAAGTTIKLTLAALGMAGPTGSGYLGS